MITSKPRRGQRLERMANFSDHINHEAEPVWEFVGTVDHCDGNLCWFVPPGASKPRDGSLFIWRYTNWLGEVTDVNRCHRIQPVEESE